MINSLGVIIHLYIHMSNVTYWITSSADDLDSAEKLLEGKKYHHALFFLHLSLEKILKAIYVKKKDEPSPPIHDLVRLAEKSALAISEEIKLQLAEISTYNIAARYDDYKLRFYKKASKEYAEKWMKIGHELLEMLNKKL